MYDKAYIAHHGIKGQKWGVQNGPPYPIGSDGASKGTHRHIVKSKLSDEQKKKLGKLGKAALIGAGVTTAATAAAAGAGLGVYMIAKNPQAVAGALAKIGSKTVSALGKTGIMTGKMAIEKLKKDSPELFAKMLRETGEITGKSAKQALKSTKLSNVAKATVASGDTNAIHRLILNNYDKFKTNAKALGILAPYVDDAIKGASEEMKKKLPTGAGLRQITNSAKSIKEAKAAGGKAARIVAGSSGAFIGLNAATNAVNDISRFYNTNKNNALIKDGKKFVSHILTTKNHYDDDLERKKK